MAKTASNDDDSPTRRLEDVSKKLEDASIELQELVELMRKALGSQPPPVLPPIPGGA